MTRPRPGGVPKWSAWNPDQYSEPGAAAGARPHHDGHAPAARHREGQALAFRWAADEASDGSGSGRQSNGQNNRLRRAANGVVALQSRGTVARFAVSRSRPGGGALHAARWAPAWFYEATTASKGVVAKFSGVGQVHLGAFEEKGGNWLDGRTPIGCACRPILRSDISGRSPFRTSTRACPFTALNAAGSSD
jgi:hypothetical protein